MSSTLHIDMLQAALKQARALHARFAACCGEIADKGATADAAADAIASHLGTTTGGELPLAARTLWQDRVARPLRSDATKPLPARSIAAVRSWPSSRIAELHNALNEIEAILAQAENDALNETI